ncbi:hypothetical protein HPC62_01915 [Thermoleptolyngbya sichuanensis A183]|uniref:Uncharacterized protein n=1 Tax=Thermoleptolyngbya sichuanensis A183 TaxID=2737172 RepID=A0A6M8BCT8_9CYAN|nr:MULTISPECIES: hypothetical protein [Thermoleptolyngbya]MDG2615292.1 hypothetical protein [Thermoleptolyngbya sichuanensis XZ-Cy5]QKD81093.1 hypothetical protein HPC62_01915 [Thermoleptolyngbya sichuanensis A183]
MDTKEWRGKLVQQAGAINWLGELVQKIGTANWHTSPTEGDRPPLPLKQEVCCTVL